MKKYIIQSGDSLGTIANKFYGDPMKYLEIARANNISDPNVISVGQELLLPGLEVETSNATTQVPDFEADISRSQLYSAHSLRAIMPLASNDNILKYLDALNMGINKFNIGSPLRAAHFIAQLAHESGSFKYSSENLNYSVRGLRSVFGKYFPTEEMAQAYARQPEKIANRVYANRMGNSDENSGDGWRYRGRGLIQLTGKENYLNCGRALGLDLVNHPDILGEDPQIAVAAAAWFWNTRKLSSYADQDDIISITKRINGGLHGIEDREAFLARAKAALMAT